MSRILTAVGVFAAALTCISCKDPARFSPPENAGKAFFSQFAFQDLICQYPNGNLLYPKPSKPFSKNIPAVEYEVDLSESRPEVVFSGRRLVVASVDGAEAGFAYSPSGRIAYRGSPGRHSVKIGLPSAGLTPAPKGNRNPFGNPSLDLPAAAGNVCGISRFFFGGDFPERRNFAELYESLARAVKAKEVDRWDAWRLMYCLYPEESAQVISSLGTDLPAMAGMTEKIRTVLEESLHAKKRLLSHLFKNGEKKRSFAFVKRHPIDGSYIGYTEGLSDAFGECTFAPESELCVVDLFPDGNVKERTLLKSPNGVIRDPDVSYDGKRLMFSWKKAPDDDYHIYEMTISEGGDFSSPKQLTFGKFADTEAAYLPNGDIVFSSTRCAQSVDCYSAEVSNLYMMRPDASFMRRVGFDQVHTLYPKPLPSGDVVYTRWDYSDRAQIFTQALFTMRSDGSFQTELYGNKSWFPTSIIHARGVPSSSKIMAVLSGHHTGQRGKLALIDPSKGTQEGEGITLLAPVRKPDAQRIDKYGQTGPQFSYPFPLSEKLFLTSFSPHSEWAHLHNLPASLFLMDADGNMLLISSHPYLHALQAVEIAPRQKPPQRPSQVDYSKSTAELFIRNVYDGYATSTLPRGSLKKLRIVRPLFERRAPIGNLKFTNDEGGVKIRADVFTPVSLAHGSWDAKEVLGEVPIAADGSVHFEVPARTPVYFQIVDADGNVAATMRSWAGFQPGEFYSCAGCHGNKNLEDSSKRELVRDKKPERTQPFYDIKEFSFRKNIQPILDDKCIACHNNRYSKRVKVTDGSYLSVGEIAPNPEYKTPEGSGRAPFSLLDVPVPNPDAKRIFNDAYCNLLSPTIGKNIFDADFRSRLVNWPGALSVPTPLPAYYRGAAKSSLVKMLSQGHSGVEMTREEIEKIACWIDLGVPYCGDYTEAADWSDEEKAAWNYYSQKAAKEREREQKAISDEIHRRAQIDAEK